MATPQFEKIPVYRSHGVATSTSEETWEGRRFTPRPLNEIIQDSGDQECVIANGHPMSPLSSSTVSCEGGGRRGRGGGRGGEGRGGCGRRDSMGGTRGSNQRKERQFAQLLQNNLSMFCSLYCETKVTHLSPAHGNFQNKQCCVAK